MNLQTPKLGDFGISLSGHDKGRMYVVIKVIDAEFVLVADGKYRGMKNPKKKRLKHLKLDGITAAPATVEKLVDGNLKDNELHKLVLAKQKANGQN